MSDALAQTGAASLGYWLESHFGRHYEACIGVPDSRPRVRLRRWGADEILPVTAVPDFLVSEFELQERDQGGLVQPLQTGSLMRLFTHVVAQVEPLALSDKVISFENSDQPVDGRALLTPGVTATAFAANCTSTLSAAISANARIGVEPAAHLRAVIDADTGRRLGSEIRIFSGTFRSPIALMWNGEVQGQRIAPELRRSARIFSGLEFWNYFHLNGGEPDNALQLVESFSGYYLERQRVNANSNRLRTVIEADARTPFGGGEADLDAGLEFVTGGDASEFSVAPRLARSEMRLSQDVKLFSLPTVARLQAEFRERPVFEIVTEAVDGVAMTQNASRADLSLIDDQSGTIVVRADGIPSFMCQSTSEWSVSDPSGFERGAINILDIDHVGYGCFMALSLSPNGVTGAASELDPNTRTVGFSLRPALPVQVSGGVEYLDLAVEELRFSTVTKPRLARPSLTAVDPQTREFTLEYPIEESTDNPLVGRLYEFRPELRCDGSDFPDFTTNINLITSNGRRFIRLSVALRPTRTDAVQLCDVGGEIDFVIRSRRGNETPIARAVPARTVHLTSQNAEISR
ncbi:MAG: hypothetical protein NXI12_08810 [Alphaproteobacteria bacterium]|nr:hypothetical protein [Alphaproteobacteria bacterium]